ncbi:hypothetical protein V8G54_016451 [Vigna mungo]|uniref:Transmembrane protein n=1 Tax=Vigna mungo TaxID=3915 RepID=A0AAQ3NL50_VIGMU
MEFEIRVACDIIDSEDLAVWVVQFNFLCFWVLVFDLEVRDTGSGGLRKSCDGGGAFMIWGRLRLRWWWPWRLRVMATMVLCRGDFTVAWLLWAISAATVAGYVTRKKVGFQFLFGLKVEEDGDVAKLNIISEEDCTLEQ